MVSVQVCDDLLHKPAGDAGALAVMDWLLRELMRFVQDPRAGMRQLLVAITGLGIGAGSIARFKGEQVGGTVG